MPGGEDKTMSNVNKKDRSKNRFTVLDAALDLYDHTTTLIANKKVFDRTYKGLIDSLDNEAALIYHLCRSANEDLDARVQDEAIMRIQMQEEALNHCKWLKTYILLAQRKFHLRAKKTIYWNSMVKRTRDLIKAWNDAEKRNYKDKYGL